MTPFDHPAWRRAGYRADRALLRLEQGLLAGSVAALVVLNVTVVVGRNLFGSGLAFAEELNQGLMILLTFGGLAYAVREGRHIRMTAFYDLLQGRARKALMVVICAGTAALLWLLAWYGLQYVLQVQRVGSVTPALRIPLWCLYAVAPLGLALGGLQYLRALWRNLRSPGVWLSVDQPDDYRAPPEQV